MKRTGFAAAGLAMAVMCVAARGAASRPPEIYEGALDGKIAVTMELSEGGMNKTVSGSYMYAIRGKDMYLKGKAEGTRLTLTEETSTGTRTGTFVLARNVDETLTGTWTSADGKRELSVGLAKIASKKAQVESHPGSYDVHMGYPEFPSRSRFLQELNAQLAWDARDGADAALVEAKADAAAQAKDPKGLGHHEFAASSDPEVTFADAAMVSIRTVHMLDTGGAHPNYTYTAATYAWENQKMVTLGVNDLVKSGSIKSLAAVCVTRLREQKASWPEQVVMDKEHPPRVNVTKAGLLVTFDPYEAGSYAEGTYTVVIPWKEAAEMIPAESPIRRLTGAAPAEAAAPGPGAPRTPAVPVGGGGDFPHPG